MILRDLATVIRSKNAGPYILTFDVLFTDDEALRKVQQAGLFDRAAVAKAYGLSANEVLSFEIHPFIRAAKFSIRRPVASGSFGDSDVYGAQQYAPLLDLKVL